VDLARRIAAMIFRERLWVIRVTCENNVVNQSKRNLRRTHGGSTSASSYMLGGKKKTSRKDDSIKKFGMKRYDSNIHHPL